MAENINIFVRSSESAEELAREVELLLGIDLALVNEGSILYRYSDSKNRWLQISRHTLINDALNGLNFESYQYQIEVGAFGVREWEERNSIMNEFARLIFEKLRTAGTHDLLLVQDVSSKLDEFRISQ